MNTCGRKSEKLKVCKLGGGGHSNWCSLSQTTWLKYLNRRTSCRKLGILCGSMQDRKQYIQSEFCSRLGGKLSLETHSQDFHTPVYLPAEVNMVSLDILWQCHTTITHGAIGHCTYQALHSNSSATILTLLISMQCIRLKELQLLISSKTTFLITSKKTQTYGSNS